MNKVVRSVFTALLVMMAVTLSRSQLLLLNVIRIFIRSAGNGY